MTFYQLMQLGVGNIKSLIKEAEDEKLKKKYIMALVTKDILCLLFCMFVVVSFGAIFGNENSIVGVVTVIALLTFRFSNFNFNVVQSAFTIVFIFGIYMVFPHLAAISSPIVGSIINFVSIMVIVILACHNVILSNQSVLILSYLLLYGTEVSSVDVYINRVLALLAGGILVAGIFYYRQRKVTFKNTIVDIIKDVNINNDRTKWQIKFTLGICSAMLIGELMNLPKTMWIGFSCMSVIQPAKEKVEFRYKNRMIFSIVGCLIFAVIYTVLPESLRGNIGMIGGLMVGLSATYQWQTVFNCFGALVAAIPTMGLWGAITMRIINNGFGSLYSKIFDNVFDKIVERVNNKDIAEEILEG